MHINRCLNVITAFAIVAVSTYGEVCLAQDRAPTSVDSIQAAGNSVIAKLAAILELEDLTPEAVEILVGAPLRFVGYGQSSNGTAVTRKSRQFILRDKEVPAPFTFAWLHEKWDKHRPTELLLDVDGKVACVSEDSVVRELGRPDEMYNISFHFPAARPPVVYWYKKARGLILGFEYFSYCASRIHISGKHVQRWFPAKNEVVANAEFIEKFLPFDVSGAQLKPFGFQCAPPAKPSPSETDSRICTCPNHSDSIECRYAVHFYYWPNGDVSANVAVPR